MRNSLRIFVDVTDLLAWPGPRTGIQRVTHAVIDSLDEATGPRLMYHAEGLGFRELQARTFARLTAHANHSSAARRLTGRTGRLVGLLSSSRTAFRPGDAVLLLGGGWSRRRILDDLANVRARNGVKVYRFVHDVMPMTHPQYFHMDEVSQFAGYMHQAMAVSDHVITSSDWNARQIQALGHAGTFTSVPTTAVGLGDNYLLGVQPVAPQLDVTAGEYVLVVGSLDVRKNQRVVYQSYNLARARGLRLPTLVIAGPHGRMWQECTHLIGRDSTLHPPAIVASDVSDRELAWLYRNCLFTIYPSLCEGWGLPIGESLAFGKLCLSSNTAAMPEVGGRFARYFDPYNPVELLSLVERYLDPEARRHAEKAIEADFRPRTWHDVASALERVVTRGRALTDSDSGHPRESTRRCEDGGPSGRPASPTQDAITRSPGASNVP